MSQPTAEELLAQMRAEDLCDGETLADCIQQLRNERDGALYALDHAKADGEKAQAHIATLRAALELYRAVFPNLGLADSAGAEGPIWDEDADNLVEQGHEDATRIGELAAAALAATPEQSLARVNASAAANALESMSWSLLSHSVGSIEDFAAGMQSAAALCDDEAKRLREAARG